MSNATGVVISSASVVAFLLVTFFECFFSGEEFSLSGIESLSLSDE